MTETILEIKNPKKIIRKNEVLKDISLSVKKGEVISIIGSSGSGNQPSFALLTYSNHLQVVKSLSWGQRPEKGYDLTTYRERLRYGFSNPSTSLKTLMSWKMLS